MQWPWSKKEPEKKVEYIPVPSYGNYSELWQNQIYLREVSNVTTTRVWTVEVTEALRMLRGCADTAESPDQLKGINNCIGIVKKMFLLNSVAKRFADDMKVREEQGANG